MSQKVMFRHCDPAGIVFFPKYFEMINDCVEGFFAEVLLLPFEVLLKTGGVPTVSISTDFKVPSFHGDELGLALTPMKLGNSSMQLKICGSCDGQLRFTSQSTLVFVDNIGRPTPWPLEIKKVVGEIITSRIGTEHGK